MMDIQNNEGNFLVGWVTLLKTKWEIMNYGKNDSNTIGFPGEYDINGVMYKCIDAGDMLHYIIHAEDDTWTAILQSSAALEKENIDGITARYVLDETTQKELENLELGGTISILE